MGHQTKPRNPRWRSRFEYDLPAIVRRARDGEPDPTNGLVRDGEPDKAWAVLKYFCDTVQKGESVDPKILEYLAEAFGKMLDGESADKALGLTHRRGRKKKEGELDLEIGYEVSKLIKAGIKYEAVIKKVMDYFNKMMKDSGVENFSIGKRSVEYAYKKYKEVNDTDYHPSQSRRKPSKPK